MSEGGKRLNEMREVLQAVIRKAETGLKVTDERHCQQLLREICYTTAEYVTK
jgi:hypothetical protein